MIDLKPPEDEPLKVHFTEEQEQAFREFEQRQNILLNKIPEAQVSFIEDSTIVHELHEISKTLKAILREMGKRK